MILVKAAKLWQYVLVPVNLVKHGVSNNTLKNQNHGVVYFVIPVREAKPVQV